MDGSAASLSSEEGFVDVTSESPLDVGRLPQRLRFTPASPPLASQTSDSVLLDSESGDSADFLDSQTEQTEAVEHSYQSFASPQHRDLDKCLHREDVFRTARKDAHHHYEEEVFQSARKEPFATPLDHGHLGQDGLDALESPHKAQRSLPDRASPFEASLASQARPGSPVEGSFADVVDPVSPEGAEETFGRLERVSALAEETQLSLHFAQEEEAADQDLSQDIVDETLDESVLWEYSPASDGGKKRASAEERGNLTNVLRAELEDRTVLLKKRESQLAERDAELDKAHFEALMASQSLGRLGCELRLAEEDRAALRRRVRALLDVVKDQQAELQRLYARKAREAQGQDI